MVLGRKEARKSKRDEGEDLLNGWSTVVKLENNRKFLLHHLCANANAQMLEYSPKRFPGSEHDIVLNMTW